MKKSNLIILTLGLVAAIFAVDAQADKLVILHTNDTHSQLDPLPDGRGGILRRKALIDSIRRVEPHVVLVDAGDIVQGTLYYSIYKGRVEREMVNALGYDMVILGNHEFDNGMDTLAREWKQLDADLITSNYDLTSTPLAGLFKPYVVKDVDGKKIGFIGINLDPEGMISPGTCQGVIYHDAISTANNYAALLRDSLKVDYVVALTHIGYDSKSPITPTDSTLAVNSKGIDIIIGGHSHTELSPDSSKMRFANVEGKEVLVTQTGAQGVNLGKIDIDLASGKAVASLFPVDCLYDSRVDSALDSRLTMYRDGIVSQVNEILAVTSQEIERKSTLHCNWIADIVKSIGEELNDGASIDLAVVNKGGLRNGLQAGPVTVGMIMTMLPFDNRLVLVDIKGADLDEGFKIMEERGGDAISDGFDRSAIDHNKIYRIVTIDYLANGGDYMTPFTRANLVKTDVKRFDNAVIDYLRRLGGRELNLPDDKSRF